jgi:hypothetical protein
LLEVKYGHLWRYVGFSVGCNGQETPFFMPKSFIECIEEIGTPISSVSLCAAWASPLFA